MKIATWNTILAGQIVKFRYKSEKANKSYNRTVIVLDPFYRYLKKSTNRRIELLVGLEIDSDEKPPLSPIKLKQLFKTVTKQGKYIERLEKDNAILKKDSHPSQEFICCRKCGCKIAKTKKRR